MGEVCRACDARLRRDVAFKVLPPELRPTRVVAGAPRSRRGDRRVAQAVDRRRPRLGRISQRDATLAGSAGRGESLLAMDQDNAIVFADGAPGSANDQWFAGLGGIVADILHEVGVPYCKGGVMARNDSWRGSRETWRMRIADWIARSTPADLLSVDIFFDLMCAHGDAALANDVWRSAFDAAQGNVAFAKLLVEAAGDVESGLTMFGNFRTENGRIDLKKTGLFGIVTTARVLAIRHHLLERSTQARLSAVASLGHGGDADLDALARAQEVFIDLILGQQLTDMHGGLQASNEVAIKPLSRAQRARLRESLGAVRHLDALMRDLLF